MLAHLFYSDKFVQIKRQEEHYSPSPLKRRVPWRVYYGVRITASATVPPYHLLIGVGSENGRGRKKKRKRSKGRKR